MCFRSFSTFGVDLAQAQKSRPRVWVLLLLLYDPDRRTLKKDTSIRKVMRMSLVIRDVTSYRGVPYMARKLLKFPVRWRKFPCVNVRKIADA